MNFEIRDSGFYTSVQDFGRESFARYGVPQGGVMDRYSTKIANLLVGNSADAPVLEMTMSGGEFKFNQSSRVAVAGLGAQLSIDGKPVEINTAHDIEQGQVLKIGQVTRGFRVYLSVFGGFDLNSKLDSQSQFYPITPQTKIDEDTALNIKAYTTGVKTQHSTIKFNAAQLASKELKVFKGPEFDRLPENIIKELQEKTFSLSKYSSRQASQLKEKLPNTLKTILTQPVLPGTVQLTPAGNLIILMRDCQTTGGYPRVLQLSEYAINQMAQKKPGDTLNFGFE